MKFKLLYILFSWALVIATMIAIYSFSCQNADQSNETSSEVVKDVLEVVKPNENITLSAFGKYHSQFRKLAHAIIYMLLGFLFANAYTSTLKLKLIKTYIISFVSTAAYGLFDEIHQGFVEGRGTTYYDVLIDSLGGAFGVLSFAILLILCKKLFTKKIR